MRAREGPSLRDRQPRDYGRALHLVIDSTDIQPLGKGDLGIVRHAASCPRSWRKLHLSIDAYTLEVRAVEIMYRPRPAASAKTTTLNGTTLRPGGAQRVMALI